MEEQNQQSYTPQMPTMTPVADRPRTSKKSKALIIFLVLLLLAAVGALAWQYKQADDLKADKNSLNQQVSDLRAQVNSLTTNEGEEEPAQTNTDTAAAAKDFATGQVTQEDSAADARVECRVAISNLTKIWVNYGQTQTSFKKSAEVTSELGMAGPESAGNFVVLLPNGELEDGANYFYQCTAETADGKTILGGVASFAAKK